MHDLQPSDVKYRSPLQRAVFSGPMPVSSTAFLPTSSQSDQRAEDLPGKFFIMNYLFFIQFNSLANLIIYLKFFGVILFLFLLATSYLTTKQVVIKHNVARSSLDIPSQSYWVTELGSWQRLCLANSKQTYHLHGCDHKADDFMRSSCMVRLVFI